MRTDIAVSWTVERRAVEMVPYKPSSLAVMRYTKAFARAVSTIWEELSCKSSGLVSISPMIDDESAVLDGGRNGKDGE